MAHLPSSCSFSFGNDSAPPHVQLLADTATDEAAADFVAVRAELLEGAPPELAPADIIRLFDGPNAVTSAAPGYPTASSGGAPVISP